jgi:hypothetical protein
MIAGANGVQMAKFGHCPFFKFGCMLKTDPIGKPIVSNLPKHLIRNAAYVTIDMWHS